MPQPRHFERFLGERGDVHGAAMLQRDPLSGNAGLQHLLDGLLQPLGVREHHAIEVAPLPLAHIARLQRLEVEANRRDGRLQLVRHRVDERIVLIVTPDLTHEKHRVDDDARDDQDERENAEHERQVRRPLTRIHPMFSVTAAATRTTQRTTKAMVAV